VSPDPNRISRRLRSHVRSNAVGYVALFIALSGSAYAATLAPSNSVNSASIIDGQVKTRDLASNAVSRSKVKDGSISGSKLADGAVNGSKVAAGSLNGAVIKDGTIDRADLTASALLAEPVIAVAPNPQAPTDPCATGQTGIFCGTFWDGTSNTVGSWSNVGGELAPVAFYKDRAGTVHLSGAAGRDVNTTNARAFILPQGYRPAATHAFTTSCWQSSGMGNYGSCLVNVAADGSVSWQAGQFPASPDGGVSFDGIDFRVP
jgi:hypothetical protein